MATNNSIDNIGCVWYFPLYDNNGNVTDYVSETGEVVASYAYDDYVAGQKEAAEKVLAAAKAAAGRMGVEAETVYVENALPAEAIIETAKARNCSLIAMSSHGRRGLGRLVLGSVTSEVLANSSVPVLVVH